MRARYKAVPYNEAYHNTSPNRSIHHEGCSSTLFGWGASGVVKPPVISTGYFVRALLLSTLYRLSTLYSSSLVSFLFFSEQQAAIYIYYCCIIHIYCCLHTYSSSSMYNISVSTRSTAVCIVRIQQYMICFALRNRAVLLYPQLYGIHMYHT